MAPRSRKPTVKIPKTPTKIPSKITDYTWMIYGEKGIGKSCLAAELDSDRMRAYFSLERPVLARELIQIPQNTKERKLFGGVEGWPTLQAYIDEIAKGKPGRVVFDTLDMLILMVEKHWQKKLGFNPINANDYGVSFSRMRDDFNNTMQLLLWSDFKLTMTSHSRCRPRVDKSITRDEMKDLMSQGEVPNETQPTCRSWGVQWAKQQTDYVGYYGYEGRERVLHIRGGGDIYTACIGERFHQPKGAEDAGHPLNSLPMGRSPREAYANLCKAWDNKLEGYMYEE